MKYSFINDYSEGAHPRILEMLTDTNLIQEAGYGNDSMSARARALILADAGNPDADVHMLAGGTQANLILSHAMLHSYQSVIAADTGHINVHETGSIEATGHKAHSVPGVNGKLTVDGIQEVLESHHGEHMVQPRAVYLSNSTELGTVYTKAELSGISAFCRKHELLLHLDGARLGSALASDASDLTMADVAGLVDAFYIGGTKNGALLGEAIVLINPVLKTNFRYYMKQRGGLLAKGRLLGAQFVALFEDGLLYELAAHANAMAYKLADGIRAAGYGFLEEPATNQIFPILPDTLIATLQERFEFMLWQRATSTHSVPRLVTSWATREDKVEEFVAALG